MEELTLDKAGLKFTNLFSQRKHFYHYREDLDIMDSDLKEFRDAVQFEKHILADLQGTSLPEDIQPYLSEISQEFNEDESEIHKAITLLGEGEVTRAFLEFRKYLQNFPLNGMKEIYRYCNKNETLSEKQLRKYKQSIEVFEKDGLALEQKLLNHALQVGKEKIRKSKHTIRIEEKAVKKAYNLARTYQLEKNVECAGVFRYEFGTHETHLEDFRGLTNEERLSKEREVDYSDSFRDKLKDVQKNSYILMHSHPLMDREMGEIAYRPSKADLEFFRNHNSQFAIICPLLPEAFSADVSISAVSLTETGFDFLPIEVVNSDQDITAEYPSVQLYNNLLYLMSTAKLEDQSNDQAMGTLQFMLGESVMKKLC